MTTITRAGEPLGPAFVYRMSPDSDSIVEWRANQPGAPWAEFADFKAASVATKALLALTQPAGVAGRNGGTQGVPG